MFSASYTSLERHQMKQRKKSSAGLSINTDEKEKENSTAITKFFALNKTQKYKIL